MEIESHFSIIPYTFTRPLPNSLVTGLTGCEDLGAISRLPRGQSPTEVEELPETGGTISPILPPDFVR